jgi:hypothetical protein
MALWLLLVLVAVHCVQPPYACFVDVCRRAVYGSL